MRAPRAGGLALLILPIVIAGFVPRARAASRTSPAPIIPDLTPWLLKDGKPGRGAWRHAARFSIPYEIQPAHNAPAPVSTRVYAGYTADALWLEFLASDPHPGDIAARYREHDDISSDSDDYVGIFLSPFDDTQWAYEFFCTPGGVEYDAFRQQNNEIVSWNAVWSCNASLTPTGYRVVMKIPFAAIKFPHSAAPQRWGLIFFRNWPRNLDHQLFSEPLNYNSNCTLCSLLTVRTATAIKTKRTDLQVIPAVTLIRTDSRKGGAVTGLEPGSPKLQASLGANWVIRPDLEWSATINPNFSEVAPDVLQLSANQQFALFYMENRPFFEQGTQVFNTPNVRLSSDTYMPSGALADTLDIADPRYASKFVGQLGANAIGALATEDETTNILLPGPEGSTMRSFGFATQDALLRYRRDVGASAFGLFASDRSGSGYDSGLYSADGQWQVDPSDVVTALAGSSTTSYPSAVADAFGISPGTVKGSLWNLDYARTRRSYNFDVDLLRVDPGFRADLGYLPQVGYEQGAVTGEYDFYAPDLDWWQNGGFGVIGNWTRPTAGGPSLDRKVDFYTFVHSQYQTHIVLYARRDQQYYRGKTFTLDQFETTASAQPTSWLNGTIDVEGGDGIDYTGARKGGLLSVSTTLDFALGRHLSIDLANDYEQLNLAGRQLFTANVYDLRLGWYFNARLFLTAIGQGQIVHNNTALYPASVPLHSGTFATQYLVGYQINPWTVFYAGSSEGYQETNAGELLPEQRSYFLKASYYLQP